MSDSIALGAEISAAMMELDQRWGRAFNPRGLARQQLWRCGDGWIVGYTTERITESRDGKNDGKFACLAYKPIGKGARSGKADEHELVYFQTYSKRKTARARAETLYDKHSSK